MDPLDRLIVEKLGGGSTSEEQQQAETDRAKAAASKLRVEAVSTLIQSLPEGDPVRHQLVAKAVSFAMDFLSELVTKICLQFR